MKKGYPYNLLEKIYGGEIDFALPTDFDGTLEYVLHTLTDREYDVIKMRFVEGLTYEKCGKPYGVTRERIRQVEDKAIRKLRAFRRMTMLRYGIGGYVDYIISDIKNMYEAKEELKSGNVKDNEHIKKLSIEAMDLSVRAYNCLVRANIKTVDDLLNIEPAELMKVRNLGIKSYDDVVKKLGEYGVDTQKFIDYKKGCLND